MLTFLTARLPFSLLRQISTDLLFLMPRIGASRSALHRVLTNTRLIAACIVFAKGADASLRDDARTI